MSFRHLSAVVLGLALCNALPSLAAEAPIPIADFVRGSRFSVPRLSPDGKYLAVRVNAQIEGRDQKLLSIYAIDGLKLLSTIRLPQFELPLNFFWVSNTRLVVAKGKDLGSLEAPVTTGELLGTDFNGENQEYLYGRNRWALQRRGATGEKDRGYGFVHSIPDQPNGQFYMRERTWGENRSFLYDVNAANGVRKLVADVSQPNLDYLLQHDGKPRFAFGFNDENRQIVFRRDAERDNWQPLPAEKIGLGYTPIAFTPDDQNFYLLFSEKGGPEVLMRQSMSGDERTLIASDSIGDINTIQYGPRPSQPFAVTSELGIPAVRYVDENSPDAQLHKVLSKQFPGQYVNFATFSADGNKLLFTVSSDREPGEYYLFDRNTKKAEFLVAVRPEIDASRMAARKPIQFKARDGLELHGYLTLPLKPTGQKVPLILLPHGGPHGIADVWFWDANAQFLASRGYGVLQVNYRGSGGRGENFIRAGYRKWATGVQQDLIDGVRWTVAQGITDPGRVCVFGGSFGAYSAMMTTILEPDMFKCAVGYAGLYDLPLLLGDYETRSNSSRFNYLSEVIGKDPTALEKDSPSYLADKIRVPLLLVHGEEDEVTPLVQAEAMRKALTKAGKPFEWMLVPKEGHGFYAEKNRIAFYEKLEAFLAKHLSP